MSSITIRVIDWSKVKPGDRVRLTDCSHWGKSYGLSDGDEGVFVKAINGNVIVKWDRTGKEFPIGMYWFTGSTEGYPVCVRLLASLVSVLVEVNQGPDVYTALIDADKFDAKIHKRISI